MNNDETYTPCTSCGRPMRYCKGQCCGKTKGCQCKEYCGSTCAAIRPGEPKCPPQAVIPSLTVESVSNLKDLADCFVHVSDINTTFYIDDKHRIMTTWAGLVSVEDYDFAANPLNLRGQIAYDAKNNTAAIYDKQGANYIFQISDINNDYMLLQNKPQINGVTLLGNKSLGDLGITDAIDDAVAEEKAEREAADEAIQDELLSRAVAFDTVADMKAATNFVNGSYAQTLGYHAKNDGGASLYRVRTLANDDVVDEATIIALADETLIAELVPINKTLTPEMFGAYGDNSHDDTSAFQKACSFISTNGGGILLCVNKYIITGEIDISNLSNIKFDGNGKGELIKPENNNTNIFFGDRASKIKFYSLTLEGNRPETLDFTWPHVMNAAIICRYGEDITVENCIFNDFYYGVCTATSENSHNARIDKCDFNRCNSDIDLYGKPLVSITNVSSNGCTGNSIQFEPSSAQAHETTYNYLNEPNLDSISVNNTIQGCSVVNCSGIAINIQSGSINIIVSNNMLANCGQGIYCNHLNSKNVVIANNTILNITKERESDNARSQYPDGAGIALSANVFGAVVTDNIINHARTGIFVAGSSSVGGAQATGYLIKGNSVQYCKTSGIAINYAQDCQVSDNYLYNNAIGLDGGTTYYKNSGIYLGNSTRINCDSNYCLDTSELTTRQRACVYIDSGTCTDISVSNCTGINMVENPVNNDAATHGCYANGSKVYTSPFTAATNTN